MSMNARLSWVGWFKVLRFPIPRGHMRRKARLPWAARLRGGGQQAQHLQLGDDQQVCDGHLAPAHKPAAAQPEALQGLRCNDGDSGVVATEWRQAAARLLLCNSGSALLASAHPQLCNATHVHHSMRRL